MKGRLGIAELRVNLVSGATARFRTIRAKGSLKDLDELPGIPVDEGITPGYLDEITHELRRDYYDKWIASKQST